METTKCTFMAPLGVERVYEPIKPQADNGHLSERGDRLILYHRMWSEPELRIAPRGEPTAGWVIGVFVD